ncbi:MAG: hypothetical protein KDM64_11620 [Verrucomicrobiae bacterium]|nr:hypothetical protein [Verrucomicrobiae bacterium]
MSGWFLSGQAVGDEAAPRFLFSTGEPTWRGERIPLPPGFAKDMGWRGFEEIRFAPGMFEPDSEQFFTYVLAFSLEPGTNTGEEKLKREFLAYYRGLAKAVLGGKGRTVATEDFSLTLEKATVESAPIGAGDVSAYRAELSWIEPFATGKAQTLHFEIHTWNQGARQAVFACVSPLTPDQGALWKSLREIRSTFHFGD